MNFSDKQINNGLGWMTFVIALITYVLTLEPTVSFWDCGEYIATSVKLMVGHPPGAPVFQLIANVMSQLALGDVTRQAFYVNLTSGLSSAFTIPFLFWTITAMGRKLFDSDSLSPGQRIVMYAGGVVGALAFTWSDSFWFSAVEGEVYAMSSCFTAIAFWAVLKWEAAVDTDPYANRWLMLIAYMTGLSVGVHILVFLTIPSVVMIYFYKKQSKINIRTWIMGNAAAIGVLALVFAVIIPVVLKLFGFLEITAVNSIGLPKNSGSIMALLLIAGSMVFGVRWAHKHNKPLLSQGIHAVLFLLIGYSSFAVLAIRSNANTPIDENNPEDAMSLLSYYNRDQYGSWPILYGQSFNSELDTRKPYKDGSPYYIFSETTGKYEVMNDGKAAFPNYKDADKSFFPRMWSDKEPSHIQNYQKIMGVKKTDKITFADHFGFFLEYQVGKMYLRYFMWNFVGRQNDDQHRYEKSKGNWLSGITPWDSARLGQQKNLPDQFKNNPARNTYYALPFLLGLIGLYYQYKKDKNNAWVVTLLFLMTGLAIVVYTNHKPFEPRERDYAFVGSFYVYAIWIGLGVIGLYEMLGKMRSKATAWTVTGITLLIPAIMVAENWDDHDRSDRYVAREVAKMYLDSCEPNAILFTNGDNDTFPLWYVQEVEGYRTDVRIVNLSLLNTDWYIDMMKRKFYDSDPVPFSYDKSQYVQGTRDVLYFQNDPSLLSRLGLSASKLGDYWPVEKFIEYSKIDNPAVEFTAFAQTESPKKLRWFPMKNFRVNIDKQAVLDAGVVALADSASIVDHIDWNWQGQAIQKRDLMLIDLIASNDWSRPIYFSTTVGTSAKSFFWLQKHFRLEGLAYRFVPVFTDVKKGSMEFGSVATEKMHALMVNHEGEAGKFNFGNMEKEGVYLDETTRRSSFNLRSNYGRLANALVDRGDSAKAIETIDFAMEKMPVSKLKYDYFILSLVEGYFRAGALGKGREHVNAFAAELEAELRYYATFKSTERSSVNQEIQSALQYYNMLVRMVIQYEHQNDFSQGNLGQIDLVITYEELASLFK